MNVCETCGAEVYRPSLHKAWHEAHDAREQALTDRVAVIETYLEQRDHP